MSKATTLKCYSVSFNQVITIVSQFGYYNLHPIFPFINNTVA